MQHVEPHRVEDKDVATPRRAPIHAVQVERRKVVAVQRRAERLAGFQDQPRRNRLDHRRHASQMIGVAVGSHHGSQFPNAMGPKERHDHGPTGVEECSTRACVDQYPGPPRAADGDRIALTDIQHVNAHRIGAIPAHHRGENHHAPEHHRHRGHGPAEFSPSGSAPAYPHDGGQYARPR